MSKLTVCGGGNAAHAIIALAGNAGWNVDVYAPLADESERLKAGMAAQGGMAARIGDQIIKGQAHRVSPDPAKVIPGSELVLLALPSFAHGFTLETIADYLEPEAAIFALPARGGFDYQVRSILGAKGLSSPFFGLQTLPWACRIASYGQEVEILGTKAEVDIAVFPPGVKCDSVEQLASVFGLKFSPVASFLTLTLANTGQLIHPGIMYGLGRDKEGGTFTQAEIPFFYQGVDEPTARLLQAMSDEVQAIASEIARRHLPDFKSQEVISVHDWLLRSYPDAITDGSTLRRAFNTNQAYVGLKLPTRPVNADRLAVDYTARYLAEDVPYGLVVVRGIAELASISTPTVDEVIIWAQAHLGHHYLVNGILCGSDLDRTRAPQVYGIQNLAQLATPSSSQSVSPG